MEFQAYDVALVPVIMALVSVLSKSGLPARWLPAAAILLGIASGLFYIAPDDPKKGILAGILMGLSAIGMYSGTKNTLKKRDP